MHFLLSPSKHSELLKTLWTHISILGNSKLSIFLGPTFFPRYESHTLNRKATRSPPGPEWGGAEIGHRVDKNAGHVNVQ